MKPPKNLFTPPKDDNSGSDDKKKSVRGFGGDTFRNYMARKIELQRKQFGLVLPPDPREVSPELKKRTEPSLLKQPEYKRPEKRRKVDNDNSVRFTEHVKVLEIPALPNTRKYERKPRRSRLSRLGLWNDGDDFDYDFPSLRRVAAANSIWQEMLLSSKEERNYHSTDSLDTSSSQEPCGGNVAFCEPSQGTDIHKSSSPKKRTDLFFLGVVVIVNGFTDPDADTIQRMLHRHGGDLEKYETGRVTHIIAQHLSRAKANIYKRQRNPVPVCNPKWIVDSVQSGRRLPHAEYLIDEVRDENVGKKTMMPFFSKSPVPGSGSSQSSSVGEVTKTHLSETNAKTELAKNKDEEEQLPSVVDNQKVSNSSGGDSRCNIEVSANKSISASTDKRKEEEEIINPPRLQAESKGIEQNPTKVSKINLDGRIRTVGTDPNFLDSYFNSSRLSFIGSFKQRIKQSPTRKNSVKTERLSERFVFHVDMDCFFASVVLRNFPEHKNKPVAISHNDNKNASKKSTSECATCNYEARKFGIKKGMFLGQARRLCPNLIVLPYDFEGYEEVAEQVANILHHHAEPYNGKVEQVSCDECYMEMFLPESDGSKAAEDVAGEVAEGIRNDIFSSTKCTASIGVARNKFLSKLATDRVKPDKYMVVKDHRQILEPLRLRNLPGIGYRKERELEQEGLTTVKGIWELGDGGEGELVRILGKVTGKKVYRYCKGVDDSPITPVIRKSIGAECNYGVRFDGPYGVDYMMSGLAKEVQKRMDRVNVKGKRITLKVKQRKPGAKSPPKFLGHGSCFNHSKSLDLGAATMDWEEFSSAGMVLFEEIGVPTDDVRGMGMVVTKLDNEAPTKAAKSSASLESFWHYGRTFSKVPSSTLGQDAVNVITDKEPSNELLQQPTDHMEHNQTQAATPPYRNAVSRATGVVSRTPNEKVTRPSQGDDYPDPKSEGHVATSDEGRHRDYPVNLCSEQNEQFPIMENEIALPPVSQIHMSQVMALPASLRDTVKAMMKSARFKQNDYDRDAFVSEDATVAQVDHNEMNQLADVFDGSCSRLRQVSVKRMMKLSALKSGAETLRDTSGESISVTQLECLPLELQLQVANQDDIRLGTASPLRRSENVAYQKEPNIASRTAEVAIEESLPAIDSPGGTEIDCVVVEDSIPELGSPGSTEVDDSSDASNMDYDSKCLCDLNEPQMSNTASLSSFYHENIAPLQQWMDEQLPPGVDDISKAKEFLCLVVSENRIVDAIKMLRSIRNRDDDWSTPSVYNKQLLQAVVEKYRGMPTGGNLDIEWLGLN